MAKLKCQATWHQEAGDLKAPAKKKAGRAGKGGGGKKKAAKKVPAAKKAAKGRGVKRKAQVRSGEEGCRTAGRTLCTAALLCAHGLFGMRYAASACWGCMQVAGGAGSATHHL